MDKIKVVVVDDEYFNRGLITMLIHKLSDKFTVIGEAENLRDGFKMVRDLKPEVLFLDIKMPDGSGFELLRMFEQIHFDVVFVTGFDDFVLRAFEFNAVDYILKPIDLDKFKQTLDKLEYRMNMKRSSATEEKLLATNLYSGAYPIKWVELSKSSEVKLVNVNDVIYAQQEDTRTVFETLTENMLESPKNLDDFDFIFTQNPDFLRINHRVIVNKKHIRDFSVVIPVQLTMVNGTVFDVEAEMAKSLKVMKKDY